MILSSGPAMREAQRKISKRIIALLGIEGLSCAQQRV
jgi:hypothetical protein